MERENPFKIIKPEETPSPDLKKEVMGSVNSLVLMLRFVQLFVGDFVSVINDKLRLGNKE